MWIMISARQMQIVTLYKRNIWYQYTRSNPICTDVRNVSERVVLTPVIYSNLRMSYTLHSTDY
jgi:hypothetical protein